MVKPEWGTKRTCPKCGARFYDLGQEEPVTCIACGINWNPEPVLKSKQPMPFEAASNKPAPEAAEKKDKDLAGDDDDEDNEDDDDLDLEVDEDAEENPDDEVDLGGDDDLGEIAATKEDEES
ncbi:MAG: FYDLN acid domain-containing protein [Sphingomonas sp.]